MGSPCVVTHGGVESPPAWNDGCAKAAKAGLSHLKRSGAALEAAIRAAVALEDDPRFNAGTGSRIRIDGRTIQMDAGLMDSEGRFAGICGVQEVKNPIRVAEKLLEKTPHHLLAGEGATIFARRMGFKKYDPETEGARRKYRELKRKLKTQPVDKVFPYWRSFDATHFMEGVREAELASVDTIGAVSRDKNGRFGVAISTGGTNLALLGRVGDAPIMGAGFYAGPAGAVGTTGVGERILEKLLCLRVYEWIAHGMHPQKACLRGVELYDRAIPIGLIAVSKTAHGVAANRQMASAVAS